MKQLKYSALTNLNLLTLLSNKNVTFSLVSWSSDDHTIIVRGNMWVGVLTAETNLKGVLLCICISGVK